MLKSRIIAPLVPVLLCLSACASQRELAVSVSSGTQFRVSGNADALYFDMQGILWKLPPNGGTAAVLSDPSDDLRNVSVSPDGKWLVVQSFATGYWDILVFDTNGKQRRSLTQSSHDDRQPAWSADGSAVLFTSDRAGNDDVWSVDVATGALQQLTDNPANDFAAASLADGFVFLSDRDRITGLYRQTATNQPELLTKAPAARMHPPRVSPDERFIAWVQAARRNSFPGVAINELMLYDTTDAQVTVLSDPGADVFSVAPAWLSNSDLLYTADGEIKRVTSNASPATTTTVPFTASLPLRQASFTPAVPIAFRAGTEPMRGIVDPLVLPDDSIVFTGLGDLWQLQPDNTLLQLTDDDFVERDVALSPDGQQLVFISDRGGSMQIWLLNLQTDSAQQLTDNSSGPRYPSFAPDGKLLAYQQVGPLGTQDFTVRLLDLTTGKSRKLRSSPKIWPGRMAWSADGQFITVAELTKIGQTSAGINELVRIDTRNDQATRITLPASLVPDTGPVSSNDYRQLALVSDGSLWQLPVATDGSVAGQPAQLFDALVESPTWHPDDQSITVLTACGIVTVALDTGPGPCRTPDRTWQPAAGNGLQLIHAGRLWDGQSDVYLYDVDVLIDGHTIRTVRAHAPHPTNARVIDASESTVLPGLIDHHVHFQPHQGESVGRSLLAFGVTTVVEPGGLPYESRENMESWLSGKRLGPRLVFGGPQLDGARRTFHFASHVTNEQRLRRELERGAQLDYGLLKTYRRMRPELQAQTVKLGHAQGLPVTAHAGLRNLGVGGDRTEHLRGAGRLTYSPKQSDLLNSYGDMRAIYGMPGIAITPTLINQGGYFDFVLRDTQPVDIATIPQYTRLYPPAYRNNLNSFVRVVNRKLDLVQTGLANAGATLNTLNNAGVNIVAGTDSPIFPYGLAMVIELQNYVDAGLTPAAALRTATSNAAAAMGARDAVGKLQADMLADMVIVDGDPLQQITDLFNVQGVMLNGRYHTLEALLQ